ncbi:MAG: hypothetical protein IJW70_02870 [Clostridia bacterium]|nr:hypothetical protein [Clostridia bacterium]
MKNKKVTVNIERKKPHYKKQPDGIYNKKKGGKKKPSEGAKNRVENLVKQEQQVQPEQLNVKKPVENKAENKIENKIENKVENQVENKVESWVDMTTEPKEKSKGIPKPVLRMLIQVVLSAIFVTLGLVLLISTFALFYRPMSENNKIMNDTRLKTRMELSALLSEVFPSMNADDELSDMIMRALENKKNTLRQEANQVTGEIETLRQSDEVIAALLENAGLDSSNLKNPDTLSSGQAIIQASVDDVDKQLEELGVAALREQIDVYKGTTTTVTREDENGETITETVTTGGLVPEMQAKKDELQKKYDDVQSKLDNLDTYIEDIDLKVTQMYNRMETGEKAYDVYAKMEAISAYVKANPVDNIFIKDTSDKLASFPGESKEEDDILFIMKVESETGIRMQTVNYGQDYQLTKLSNGMLLCYEVYNIPYYATYNGWKNLMAYFNDNDDFYASIYSLTMEYNALNESIQGNMIILHYYLLSEDAEYIPPVVEEEIIPGIDGIFGEVTDNGITNGKVTDYTVGYVKDWLDGEIEDAEYPEPRTLYDFRNKLKAQGCHATELAWILKEEYSDPNEMKEFLYEYGDPDVNYENATSLEKYLTKLFECDRETLFMIYYASNDDTTEDEGEEDGTTENEPTTDGKQSDYTFADVQGLLNEGKSLEQVRDQLVDEEYEAKELAWILKEEYNTPDEVYDFFQTTEPGKYTDKEAVLELFGCTEEELKDIYGI